MPRLLAENPMRLLPLLLAPCVACAAHRHASLTTTTGLEVRGPRHVELDLLRESEDADKVYVMADLGLDTPVLFLVDTGASVSVVNDALVEALGLTPSAGRGVIEGLGGVTPWRTVVLPSLGLGDLTLRHLEVATGVGGLPGFGGGPSVQGILGNDVWQRFVLTLDYPAARLELDSPGGVPAAPTAVPMLFDGLHCYSPVRIRAGSVEHQVLLAIDSGAHGLLLSGSAGAPFAGLAVEGEEAVLGIGMGEDLPATSFMRTTRHIPVDRVALGGAVVYVDTDAQWVNFEGPDRIGPATMPGLVGYDLFKELRIVLDYPGERFAVLESTGPARALAAHDVLLAEDIRRHGDDPARGMYRARLLAWLEREDEAAAAVEAHLARQPDDAEARVFLARLSAYRGDLEGYWRWLEPLDAAALTEQGELLSAVDGLAVSGKGAEALAIAEAAAAAAPDDGEARVALADALLQLGQIARARQALAEANRISESPDGHLLRRARIAAAEGDRVAALAHARRLLEILPSSGFAVWFYQTLVQGTAEERTFRADLDRAMGRLHTDARPLDFLAAAMVRLGERAQADTLLAEGRARDCGPLEPGPSLDNCEAWYAAMADRDLDAALTRAQAATQQEPARSDFLDTLAMVHWRRGEVEQALQAARRARLLSPADVYLAWQTDHLERALSGGGGVDAGPG